MTLPSSPNRVWLLSFWLVLSLSIGAGVGAIMWAVAAPRGAWLGVIAAFALVALGLTNLRKTSSLYRAWNGLARTYARFAQLGIEAICFYTVFLAVGSTGASIRFARPEPSVDSLWVPRGTMEPDTYEGRYNVGGRGSNQKGWIRNFISWAIVSRNLWACCLLPFLMLLKVFDTEAENDTPSNIYTLF